MAESAWFCVEAATLRIGREPGKKGSDLGGAHVRRMAAAVKDNEAPGPVGVGLLGARAVMAKADALAQELEKAGWRWGLWRRGAGHGSSNAGLRAGVDWRSTSTCAVGSKTGGNRGTIEGVDRS